jgi:hypothetical protein
MCSWFFNQVLNRVIKKPKRKARHLGGLSRRLRWRTQKRNRAPIDGSQERVGIATSILGKKELGPAKAPRSDWKRSVVLISSMTQCDDDVTWSIL